MTPHSQEMHDRAELLARVHPMQTVAALIGVLPSQLTRMKKRGWKAPQNWQRRRPMPGDFAIQSRHMSHAELCAHYVAGRRTVTRWMHELPNARPKMWPGKKVRG